jgi:putative acetyltransferase
LASGIWYSRLLDRAFAPSHYESRLLAALLRNRRQIHHWTLQSRDRMLAYACYSRAYHGNQMIGYHLGPVAVDPEFQRQGLGTKLLTATLSDAALQSKAIFVLGHPAYYPRVGFRRIEQPVCPFDEGNQHFMALRYSDPIPFTIGYEPEFIQ